MTRRLLLLAAIAISGGLLVAGGVVLAQQYQRRGSPFDPFDGSDFRRGGMRRGGRGRGSPLQGLPADRAGVPDWKVNERYPNDVFTFVRVQYKIGRAHV